MEEAELYEASFTNFGANVVEKYFTQDEIEELMELMKKLVAKNKFETIDKLIFQ